MPARTFYVYEHWRPDKGVPFYVGKGRGRRAYALTERRGRSHQGIYHHLQRNGLSIEVRIIFSRVDEEMAFTLEKSQISYWRSRGIRLVNLTDGGEGTTGYKMTPEQVERKKIIVKASWSNPEIRRKQAAAIRDGNRAPETRAKRKVSGKALWADPEFRAKMIAAQIAGQNRPDVKENTRRISTERQSSPEARAKMSAAITARWARPEFRASMEARKARRKASNSN